MPRLSVIIATFLLSSCSCLLAQPLTEPVENSTSYDPLTGTQRLRRYVQQSVLNPALYAGVLGSAGIAQLNNDPPEWRQGLKGYSRRSASQFGEFAVHIGIREATAAALHYEPRYIRSGSKGFLPRLGHATLWTFLTWDSDRKIRFNIPQVAAVYGSGMISTAWYPARYSVLHDGVRNGNHQMGIAVGVNIFREFAPELKRALHLKP